jgi:hypothetical protein
MGLIMYKKATHAQQIIFFRKKTILLTGHKII